MLAPVELALKPGGRGQPRGMVYLLKGWILLGIFFVGVSAEARCRTWLEPRGRPRAVAVVAHGMNLRADRMRDLSELLRSHGA
ncbi:MAG: hypothetical protein HUU37_01960, partial [Bdellovibrionales bacterium]|nr:hypothetical protein [Bdellovibrionales bacterium]